jgi:hypothetical protein
MFDSGNNTPNTRAEGPETKPSMPFVYSLSSIESKV